jgi:hypothetical protein
VTARAVRLMARSVRDSVRGLALAAWPRAAMRGGRPNRFASTALIKEKPKSVMRRERKGASASALKAAASLLGLQERQGMQGFWKGEAQRPNSEQVRRGGEGHLKGVLEAAVILAKCSIRIEHGD